MKRILILFLCSFFLFSCSRQVKKAQAQPPNKTDKKSPVAGDKKKVIDHAKPFEEPPRPKSKLEQKRERIRQVMIGNDAPDGLITDVHGKVKSTATYRGKLLVIDFWATWCGPCLQGAPKFKEIAKRYESDQVAFISVSIDREYNTWKQFLENNQWDGEHYWLGMNRDEDLFSFLYKEVDDEGQPRVIIGVPKYVIISPEGKILDNEAEFPTNPAFEAHIKRLVSGLK